MTTSLPKPTVSTEAVEEIGEVVQQQLTIAVQKETRRKWLHIAPRAGITLLILVFLLRSVSWSTLLATLRHVHATTLLMALGIGILCVIFSSYNWHCLVLAERIRTDLARLVNLYFVGMAFSHFLPTSIGGDAVKAFYVGKESGNMAGATSAVLMSRITGFLGMLLIALPILLIWHASFSSTLIIGFLLLSLLITVMLGGIIFVSRNLSWVSSRFLKESWARHRLVLMTVEIGDALVNAIRRPRSLSLAVFFGLLFWAASFLNYYAYADALGMQVPLHFYIIAVSFSSIVAMLPISINGFGVREGSLVYAFSIAHVPAATSLLLAFLADAQVLLFGVIGGCIYLAMDSKSKN